MLRIVGVVVGNSIFRMATSSLSGFLVVAIPVLLVLFYMKILPKLCPTDLPEKSLPTPDEASSESSNRNRLEP